MDSRWFNFKKISLRKKQTLRSLIVGFAYFVILYLIAKVYDGTLCPIKRFLGIPCFGCGLTRGFMSVLKMDFKSAFEFNVLSVPLFSGIFLYAIFALTDIVFDTSLIEKTEHKMLKPYMFIIYFLVLIISYVCNYCKL